MLSGIAQLAVVGRYSILIFGLWTLIFDFPADPG